MEKEVYSNCYFCGRNLHKGQFVIKVHQYLYCDEQCLDNHIEEIKLGE